MALTQLPATQTTEEHPVKTYKITSEPFYITSGGERRYSGNLPSIGDEVLIHDTDEGDAVGDVYDTVTDLYVNLECLTELGTGGAPDRVALVEQAKALLSPDANGYEIVAMAAYLEGGAA